MNERIKELAVQAGLPTYITREIGPTIIQKFAKLLINECTEQIRLKGTDWMDFAPSQHGIRPEYVAMAQHINEHFGVE